MCVELDKLILKFMLESSLKKNKVRRLVLSATKNYYRALAGVAQWIGCIYVCARTHTHDLRLSRHIADQKGNCRLFKNSIQRIDYPCGKLLDL